MATHTRPMVVRRDGNNGGSSPPNTAQTTQVLLQRRSPAERVWLRTSHWECAEVHTRRHDGGKQEGTLLPVQASHSRPLEHVAGTFLFKKHKLRVPKRALHCPSETCGVANLNMMPAAGAYWRDQARQNYNSCLAPEALPRPKRSASD